MLNIATGKLHAFVCDNTPIVDIVDVNQEKGYLLGYIKDKKGNYVLCLCDYNRRTIISTFDYYESLRKVSISNNGKYIAIVLSHEAGSEQKILILDALSGKEIKKLIAPIPNIHHKITVSPDGKYFAIAYEPSMWPRDEEFSDEKTRIKYYGLRVFSLKTFEVVRDLKGCTDSIRTIAFSPDGKYIAAGDEDYNILLWDASTGKLRRKFQGNEYIPVKLAFSPNGKYLLAEEPTDNLSTFYLWDVATGKLIKKFVDYTINDSCSFGF